ncbi:MAG: GPW/gp25 family protein [Pseudomonadota bacterium]
MSIAVGMSATTGAALSDMAHLRQSIATILFTPVGSRVMRRSFGSLLPELIDQPDNANTRVRLFAAVAGALMRWEPRLRISRVQLASGTTPGTAELVLEGTYVPPDGPQQLLALRLPIHLQASA